MRGKKNSLAEMGILGIMMAAGMVMATPTVAAHAEETVGEWREEGGNLYWYENGVKQGTEGRGKEIYDPGTNAWYWLDAVDGGRMAKNKDVYLESWGGQYADRADGTGKWVRYDGDGHMVKGWNKNSRGTYYFDPIYGTMAKGKVVIDGKTLWFDDVTGIFGREIGDTEGYIIDEEIKHKGVDGSIEWALKKDGELVIVGICGEEQKNGWENAGWLAYKDEITGAYVDFTGAVSLRGLFAGLEKLQYVKNMEKLDTSRVTDMSKMFDGCIKLESLNLGGFDTSKVTDMSNMFYDCRSLQSLDLKNFNTGNVTNMRGMFGALK